MATFSANHGIRLLVGFTSDRAQLRRAVETLGVTQLERSADPLGLAYDLRDVGAVLADEPTEVSPDQLADTIRAIQIRYQQAEEAAYRRRVITLIDSLERLAKALDAVQGRKQVIYLSEGFEDTTLVGETGSQAARDSNAVISGRLWEVRSESRFGDTEVRHQMAEVIRRFSTSDSVIHAVDLSGLSARGDARQQTGEPVRRSGLESLSQISSLAGGRLFKSSNDLKPAFDEIDEMSRRYYLVAFEPYELRGPGRFYKLRVRVKSKKLRVSHRSGYYERAPASERTPLFRQFEAAEVIAKGVTGGEIDVRAMAIPYRGAGGKIVLPVVLELEGASLWGTAGAAARKLGLEIYGYALDASGAIEDFVALASNIDLPRVEDKLKERGLQCHATFTLPAGRHSLRFLVRDAVSGRSGAHWLDLTVPSFDTGHVMLFPPLFMDDPERWVVLEAKSRRTSEPVRPFRVAATAFAPRARPRVASGEPHRVCLLAYDGGARYDPGASFEIRPQVLDANGAPVAVGGFQLARSEADGEGFRRFVLSFTPDGVAAGDYTLRVRLRDPASGRVSEAYQAVRFE